MEQQQHMGESQSGAVLNNGVDIFYLAGLQDERCDSGKNCLRCVFWQLQKAVPQVQAQDVGRDISFERYTLVLDLGQFLAALGLQLGGPATLAQRESSLEFGITSYWGIGGLWNHITAACKGNHQAANNLMVLACFDCAESCHDWCCQGVLT